MTASDPAPSPAAISGKDTLLLTLATFASVPAGGLASVTYLVLTAPEHGSWKPSLGALLVGSAASVAMILGGVYLLLIRRRRLSWRDLGFGGTTVRWIVLSMVVGAALVPAASAVQWAFGISIDERLIRFIAPEGFTWSGLAGALVFVGCLTPLAEEVYFRGVLYRWMRGRWGVAAAVPASAVVFGLAHPFYPWPLMIGVTVFGIVFALAYERSGSLWPPIAIHATNNSVGIALLYLTLPR